MYIPGKIKFKKSKRPSQGEIKPDSLFKAISAELPLAGSFRLLFTLHRGLFIMLSLTYFLDNTVFRGLSFKTAKRVIERLIFFNSNLTHLYSLPPQNCRGQIQSQGTLYYIAAI